MSAPLTTGTHRLVAGVALALLAVVGSPAIAEDRADAFKSATSAAGTRDIREAWLAGSTDRYPHFVLGDRAEPTALVVRRPSGAHLRLTLPADSVFEDRQPRLVDLDGDGTDEVVVVRSTRQGGSSLVVAAIRHDQLVIVAETPAIGTPNRWLNPAGIADYDGDGRLDIAYVQMPHILGLLRVVTLQAGRLVQIAEAPGFSNHQAGSRAIGLSATVPLAVDGKIRPVLILPTRDRRALRLVTLDRHTDADTRVTDRGCIPLDHPLNSDLTVDMSDPSTPRLRVAGSPARSAPADAVPQAARIYDLTHRPYRQRRCT